MSGKNFSAITRRGMLKSKFIVFAIMCIINIKVCQAQTTVIEAHFRGGAKALSKVLSAELHKQQNNYDTGVCTTSAVFARFSVDSHGNITDLVFSEPEGSPAVFRKILEAVVMSTSGKWEPRQVAGKPVKSLPIVLPLVYDMQAGCYPQKVTDSASAAKQIVRPIQNRLLDAFYQLPAFKDDKGITQPSTNEIWLAPLIISSIN